MNKLNNIINSQRLPFLSWIILPLIIVWLSVNYLIGIIQQADWEKTPPEESQVLAAQSSISPQSDKFDDINWQGEGLVTLWFDDAWLDQYSEALPLLEEYQYVGALAVPTKLLGYEAYMTWAQVKRIHFKGWEVTAHSRTHNCDVNSLTPENIQDEVYGSLVDLQAQNLYPDHYVTACGAENTEIRETVKKHFLSLRTTEDGLNPLPVKDPYNLKVKEINPKVTQAMIKTWIQEASVTKSWLILMFHQVDTNHHDLGVTPQNLKLILQQIKDSKLKVVVPSQALEVNLKP